MQKRHHDLPGSPEWHARRARCFNAGDASAMLGCHPSGTTRSQLLHEIYSGIAREFSDFVQEKVVNPGHRVEAVLRGAAEDILGEDLQVIGYSIDLPGISRPLGASLDGIYFMEDTSWECKSANDALRAALPHTGRDSHKLNDARNLPKGYRVQMEQQQLASPAKRTLFTAGKVDAEGNITEERHCWYASDPALRAEIIAGWKQFDADLTAYIPPAASSVEKVVAEPVEALPAPVVQVSGQLTLTDNFKVFETRLRHFLEHRLIRTPKTDQDFADLDGQIKAMKQAREALKAAEAQMLAQVQPVDQAKKTKDMLDTLLQQNCSMAERLLKDEKERRRGDIVAGGVKALADHIIALNHRLGGPYMPQVPADFGGCIKGMKSLASMEDKVATELARAKIAGNEIAERIAVNLKALEAVANLDFLFADERQLVLKAPEDCRAVITARLAEHERKEAARLEAERARIRAEEEARAAEKVRQEQAAREAEERRQQAAAEEAGRQQEAAERERQRQILGMQQPAAYLETPRELAAAPTVIPMPTKAPSPAPVTAGPPTLTLGEIKRRLAAHGIELNLSAAFLAALGIESAGRDRAAILFQEHQWPAICDALISHIAVARDQRQAA